MDDERDGRGNEALNGSKSSSSTKLSLLLMHNKQKQSPISETVQGQSLFLQ